MRILVLSDTHMPRLAEDLPQAVYDEIPKCDMILHAGDFVEKDVRDKLSSLRPTEAVFGNMDSPKLRTTLNQKEIIEFGKCRVGLIHGYGAPIDLIETVRKEFTKVDAIVFGHSHKATVLNQDGILFFNPGSPTDTIFAPYKSYGILEVVNDRIEGRIVRIQ